jgi:hypothetical protein
MLLLDPTIPIPCTAMLLQLDITISALCKALLLLVITIHTHYTDMLLLDITISTPAQPCYCWTSQSSLTHCTDRLK